MNVSLQNLQFLLVAEIRNGHQDGHRMSELEQEILHHPELRVLVGKHALERRRISAVRDFDPNHIPDILAVRPVRKGEKIRITYSPSNEDYIQSLYSYLGIIRPISESILHDSIHAYRPNRGIDTEIYEVQKAISRYEGSEPVTVGQEDISDCFDRVPIALILHLLPPITRKQTVMLQERFVQTAWKQDRPPRGGPQGHPAMCALVNMTLDFLLSPIRKEYAGKANIISYSDDLTIIGPEAIVREATGAIRSALASQGVQLNPHKSRRTRIVPGSKITLLGYEFEWGHDIHRAPVIRPKRGAYQNLSDKIAGAITNKQIHAIIQGWKAHYGWTTDPEHPRRTQQAIDEGLRRHSLRPTATH